MTLLRKPAFSALLALGLLSTGALVTPARAQQSTLFSGKLEAEHGASTHAHGNVMALYYPGAHVLRYTVTWEGLSGPVTIAHLHGPALPGHDGPPEVTVRGPYKSPLSGSVMLSSQTEQDLLDGRLYLKLHTQKAPGGEVRAWLAKSE
ncbi:CHRD domain-containing protein [Acetobacter orleanensis]|uniref:CHRD domain-containing protein n=1 Tax=Acetobacter orleanensis TaxID=104099 RepID=A0A4Y3TNZ8_9PROT|nr:CHRD domain-containing protein [Acetobacter orleanensis]GAN68397.1 hypothetical protein Abol_015_236 [Acetobacter orleanensis JCM 7639]GEB82757.1 CHRD domain-containing protein [Acetobacter orleanensis]